MSALPPKTDIRQRELNVRFGPGADIASEIKGSPTEAALFFAAELLQCQRAKLIHIADAALGQLNDFLCNKSS
jgi:hypothetical protein